VQRLGHLTPIAMPGGDKAAREPWRMAAAALSATGHGGRITSRFAAHAAAPGVSQMLATGFRCPPTTSMGRWFDAAAGLLGVREVAAFEGQAPMLLEALARRGACTTTAPELSTLVTVTAAGVLDPTPLINRLANETNAARGAALFHHAMADGLARWVAGAAQASGLHTVALGGGCFLNTLLTSLLLQRLAALGLSALQAQQAPPNDGGIALGQAWVAVCALTKKE
jgi:hydrogenase maturation protein HypF